MRKAESVFLKGFDDETRIEITETETDWIVTLPDWLPGDCSPISLSISTAWLKRDEVIKATTAFLKAVEEVN